MFLASVYMVLVLSILYWPAALAQTHTTLYGRIEQLTEHPGATFPVKLKAQQAKIDLTRTLPAHVTTQAFLTEQNSFPPSLEGTWSGNLNVWSSEFAPVNDSMDQDEVAKERNIFKKGATGQVTFDFFRQSGVLQLEPAILVFSGTLDQSSMANELQSMFGGQSTISPDQVKRQLAAMGQMPMFALCLGAVQEGHGIAGNTINSTILKNDLKQLQSGVVEEDLVTLNQDRNRAGQTKPSYSETVLRFYLRQQDQLYVQAVLVTYWPNKQFKNKMVFYGTVNRGGARTNLPSGAATNLNTNLNDIGSMLNKMLEGH